MSENMEGAKKLYNNVLLVGVTMVGAVRRFWILALKTIFNDFYKKVVTLPKSGGRGSSISQPLYADLVYLFTVFLFYISVQM